MTKKEETVSPAMAKLASDVLAGRITPTKAQVKQLAATALTNAANQPKPAPKPPAKKRS